MNVLMFLPDFKPTGPFIVAYNAARFNMDTEQKFIFLSMRSNNYPLELDCQFESFCLNSSKLPNLSLIYKLKEFIESNDISVIHAHGFWPTILSSFLPKKIAKIVTIHNNPFEDYSYEYGTVNGKIMAFLLRSRLSSFNKVVSISSFVKRSLSLSLPSSIVIYNGVEQYKSINLVQGGKLPTLHNQSQPYKIGIVSALIPRKNIFEAIDILIRLKKKGFNCTLEIVGEGILRDELEDYIECNNVKGSIKLIGKLSYNKTLIFISKLDLFLFTSFSEGFGLVLVEAMMVKTLVLARESEAALEVLGTDKLCYSSFSDLERKIIKINENARDLLDYQFTRYESKFTAYKMAQNYRDCYVEIF